MGLREVAQLACTAILLVVVIYHKRAAVALTDRRRSHSKQQEDVCAALGLRVNGLEARVTRLESRCKQAPQRETS